MNDVGISLQDYIKVWNANDNAFIPNADGTVTINVTTLPAAKFALLLTSLFGSVYEFKVVSTYQILAVPKNGDQKDIVNNDPTIAPTTDYKPDYEVPFKTPYGTDNTGAIEESGCKKDKKDSEENVENEEKVENKIDLEELAERLDNDFVKISLFDEKLTITSKNQKALEALAKLADQIDENLTIEIDTKQVVIY